MDAIDTAFIESLTKLGVAVQDDLEPVQLPLHSDSSDTVGSIKAKASPKDPVTLKNLFRNADVHPTVLDIYLTNRYGPVWITWLSDSLWMIIERDFKTTVATINKEKINALKTIHLVDSYWLDWETFEKVTQALNNNTPRFDIMQPPTIGQLINSIQVVQGIRKDMEFDEEIGRYISAIALEEGIEYLPEPLAFAQKYLGEAPKDVVSRLNELSKTSWTEADIKETPEDIQALRLLLAQAYTNFRKEQLKEQVKLLQ
jgi:hypothetical protein